MSRCDECGHHLEGPFRRAWIWVRSKFRKPAPPRRLSALDAVESAFFARDLEEIEKRAYKVKYSDLQGIHFVVRE